MAEVPKIVRERLRAASVSQTEPAHPENDLLVAFMEQSVLATEREGVLAHLALCESCRDVVALALPDIDAVTVPSTESEEGAVSISRNTPEKSRVIFAWPSMRWAALAAACVVVAAVLVVRKVESPAQKPSVQQVASAVTPDSHVPSNAINHSVSDASEVPSQSEVSNLTASPLVTTPVDKSRKRLDSMVAARSSAHQAGSSASDAAMPVAAGHDEAKMAYSAVPRTVAPNLDAPKVPAASETVEVATAAMAVNTESSPENHLDDGTAQAIVRAKPASQDAETPELSLQKKSTASGTLLGQNMPVMEVAANNKLAIPQANLMIDAAGVLQRSVDDGKTWQTALRTDGRLLCYTTRGTDIWVGGQSGLLYHSANQGATWEQIKPSLAGNVLTADVIHIGLPRPSSTNRSLPSHGPSNNGLSAEMQTGQPTSNNASAAIVVSTASGQVWTSSDGGKTWTTQ